MCNISSAIKLAPTSVHNESLIVKKLEKWEIFNFADFLLKSHLFQFHYSAIKTVIYISIDICTCILVLCKNAKCYNLTHF